MAWLDTESRVKVWYCAARAQEMLRHWSQEYSRKQLRLFREANKKQIMGYSINWASEIFILSCPVRHMGIKVI